MPLRTAAKSRFWDRYIEILKQASVAESHCWSVASRVAHSTLRGQESVSRTGLTTNFYLIRSGFSSSNAHWAGLF
jgi:hypothetical protein